MSIEEVLRPQRSKKNTTPSDDEIEKWFEMEQAEQLSKDFTAQVDGLSVRFKDAAFETFDAYTKEMEDNIKKCKDFISSEKANLIMNGLVGTGKTHLAISTMKIFPKRKSNSFISEYEGKQKEIQTYRKTRCLFLSFYEFIDELEDARNLGKKANKISDYTGYDVICLDDLRLEDLTVSVKRNLFSLINGVYEAKKKFILTTNASFKEIENYDPRIADRLYESGIALKFTNGSYRRK